MHPLSTSLGPALPENLLPPHVPGFGPWARGLYTLVPSHVLIAAIKGSDLDRSFAVGGSMPPDSTSVEEERTVFDSFMPVGGYGSTAESEIETATQ